MFFIMISPNSVDHLLQVAVIEDVVGDYVKLKRAGSRYKGNCPFHDEKTPSFVVTPNMGIYKCFGCQKGGNSIQFMMDIDNLTFTEAARQLAKRYGIELVESNSENKDAEMQFQREKENLQAANDFALEFFQEELHNSEEGKTVAMPYFRERGYTPETIRYWNLGFSPSGWDAFYQKAKKLGYSEEFLISAGLIKQRDKDGSYYDLFRNRVIFPLLGVTGKVVGFAGRIMGKVDKAPKYVNSPETLLYKKSDFLFALFQAKGTIRKEDKAYLMEGYTDVMTLHQSGITNAVASSGTALTPGQIKLIKRFTDNTTIIYDGDTAGMKASMRGINLLLEGGLNVRVVPMPEGEYPDSYCKKLGPEGFKNYLDQNEQNFITFKAKLLLEGTQNDPLKKSDAIRDIIESVSLIGDPLKRDVLIKELEHIFDISSDLIYTELGKELRKVQQQEQKQLLEEKQRQEEELMDFT
jgi:DNA primase